jgi:hypothetical protein
MNAKTASILMAIGFLMRVIPGVNPEWFPPTGCDGSNASAIWLQCMGSIEIALGGWHLVRHHALPAVRRVRD